MAFVEPMHRNKPNITYLLSNGEGRQTNLVLGRYDTETWEFHCAESENSQRDQDLGKLHRHSKQQNHRAWRSPEISRTNWPRLGAMQRPRSQMIPPFGSNHRSGVLPSSSRCRHPNGAASSDLSTWSPWYIGLHKSSKPWLGQRTTANAVRWRVGPTWRCCRSQRLGINDPVPH